MTNSQEQSFYPKSHEPLHIPNDVAKHFGSMKVTKRCNKTEDEKEYHSFECQLYNYIVQHQSIL